MGDILNLVYDKWNDIDPKPNGIEEYGLSYSLSSTQMKSFQNIKVMDCKIEEVIRNPNKIFFYHVWCRTSLEFFFNEGRLPITNEVIDTIKENKNLFLIFMNECEIEYRSSLENLNNIIKNLGINPDQVWMINNNSKLEDFKKELNCDINVHTSRRLSTVTQHYNLDLKIKKDGFFLCHNKEPKLHRLILLCLLKKYNILNDTDWSLINGRYSDKNIGNYLSIFTQTEIDQLLPEIEYFISINCYKSRYEKDYINFDNITHQQLFFEPKSYENSYFNIVTETLFSGEDIHISEKSLAPFSYYQFPLILASYQHIKYVRKTYDFDFFDDVINHDYDNIEDDRDRIFRFIEEIKRIHDNKDFFINFYEKNIDRFIKNREKIMSFTHEYDYNFFKKLNSYEQ